ncbi:hypothetical protein QRE66_05140 [Bacillus cereus]|nr:hypothetical protein QRE66_05140 [Bacillus cereus]
MTEIATHQGNFQVKKTNIVHDVKYASDVIQETFAATEGISESKLIHYFAIQQQKQMDLALKKWQIAQEMYKGLLIDMNHGISKTINYNPQAFK